MWYFFLIPAVPFIMHMGIVLFEYLRNLLLYQRYFSEKVYLVTFGTLGPPYDNGINLLKELSLLYEKYFWHTKEIFIFTPIDLDPYYTKKMKCLKTADQKVKLHCDGAKHSYWKWKPQVILKALENLKEGEILFYTDSNISKYPHKFKNPEMISEACAKLLDISGTDISASCNFMGSRNFNFVKDGDLHPHVFIDRIVVRKSSWSVEFIKKWSELCDTDLILPPENDSSGLIIHLHDQAVFNSLVSQYKRSGMIPVNWPNNYTFPPGRFQWDNIIPSIPSPLSQPYIYCQALWIHFLRTFSPQYLNSKYKPCGC